MILIWNVVTPISQYWLLQNEEVSGFGLVSKVLVDVSLKQLKDVCPVKWVSVYNIRIYELVKEFVLFVHNSTAKYCFCIFRTNEALGLLSTLFLENKGYL